MRSWAATRASLRRTSSASRSGEGGVCDAPLSSSRDSRCSWLSGFSEEEARGLPRDAAPLPFGGAMVQNVDGLLEKQQGRGRVTANWSRKSFENYHGAT